MNGKVETASGAEMEAKSRIDLPVLLPDVFDERDACVRRLEALLSGQVGISRVHVVPATDGEAAALCLHYDPEVMPLAQVERLARAAGAEVTERFGHVVLPIRAVDAEDAGRRIEDGLSGVAGVISATVNFPAQRVRIEFERRSTTTNRLRESLGELGYAAGEEADAGCCRPREAVPEEASWYQRNKELVWSLVAAALLVLAWSGERLLGVPHRVALALYLASYVFGGWDLLRHFLGSLRKGRFTFDIDLLMLVAAVGAAFLGEWAEGAFLLVLFSIAHALEHYAVGRARNAIRALADLSPPMAIVLRDGKQMQVAVEQVAVGDVVLVRPAERIPVDGKIRSGNSAVNQAPVTGESIPVEKTVDDEVFAGTVNGDGALEVVSTRAAGDRTLDRVIKLVEEAQTQKAPTQQFSERFEKIFVPLVLIADLLLIAVPPLAGWWTWDASFYRGMALLVAASPCALALGTPATVLAGIAQAARNGVLIKGGAHLENLGTLRAMALDKTGTLTVGKPDVTDLIAAEGSDEQELLRVAAAVERRSQHPLAQAVVRRADASGTILPEAGELESLTGRGVRSSVDGQVTEIGSLRIWEEAGTGIPAELVQSAERLKSNGRSIMVVRHGERWLGVIGLADQPRQGVREILQQLRNLGIRPLVMLTGDNRGVGEAVGKTLGVDEVRADLLPDGKVAALKELLTQHQQVAMVGDGVNDAPALANATVGIAMGGAGTAVALETADVALMADDLGKLPFAVRLSRQAKGIIRQNLIIALAVIVLLMVATTTGRFGIGLAVFFHEGSTLVVLGNALRLLLLRPSPAVGGSR